MTAENRNADLINPPETRIKEQHTDVLTRIAPEMTEAILNHISTKTEDRLTAKRMHTGKDLREEMVAILTGQNVTIGRVATEVLPDRSLLRKEDLLTARKEVLKKDLPEEVVAILIVPNAMNIAEKNNTDVNPIHAKLPRQKALKEKIMD